MLDFLFYLIAVLVAYGLGRLNLSPGLQVAATAAAREALSRGGKLASETAAEALRLVRELDTREDLTGEAKLHQAALRLQVWLEGRQCPVGYNTARRLAQTAHALSRVFSLHQAEG